jgi:hypothetical protein
MTTCLPLFDHEAFSSHEEHEDVFATKADGAMAQRATTIGRMRAEF